jgi:hypothetical protein
MEGLLTCPAFHSCAISLFSEGFFCWGITVKSVVLLLFLWGSLAKSHGLGSSSVRQRLGSIRVRIFQ